MKRDWSTAPCGRRVGRGGGVVAGKHYCFRHLEKAQAAAAAAEAAAAAKDEG